MEFFDRKEEVLEIQLTQEGKRLLAKGEFKPFYYEFFDDDILYDSVGSGFDELQNSSIPRIKETPRIKTQNIVYGIETEFNKLKQFAELKEKEANPGFKLTYTKNYLYNKNHEPLKCALGLGDYSTNYVPAWNLSLVSGLINTSSFSYTYSAEQDLYENIPQIYCTSSYVYQARSDVEAYNELPETTDDKIIFKSDIFKDSLGNENYYVIREQNNLYAILNELNSTFDKENFDIEIFEVEKTDGQKENLNNLYFLKDYLDLETFFIDQETTENNQTNKKDVQWYFSVFADQQIEEYEQKEKQVKFEPYADQNAENSQEPC